MRKKIFFSGISFLMFLLFSVNSFATTGNNCLKFTGNFFRGNGSNGVDSILVIPDEYGHPSNNAVITINRDGSFGGEIGSFLLKISLQQNATNDNVSFTVIDNMSIADALGNPVSENHFAQSFLKSFFNHGVVGYTYYYNNGYSMDNGSYVWYANQTGDFKSLFFENGKIYDVAIAQNDINKFYVLVYYDTGYLKIFKVDAALTQSTEEYSYSIPADYNANAQLFYDLDEEEGADVTLLIYLSKYDENNNKIVQNKFYEFTPDSNGDLNSDPGDITSTIENSQNVTKWLGDKDYCDTEYDFFKYNFDSIGVYKDNDLDNDTMDMALVNTFRLWDPHNISIVGNVMYVANMGMGLQAVDISSPETTDINSIIGDTNDYFWGFLQDAKPMVINGDLYILVAGGQAGLGVFKANSCYPNFDIDRLFSENPCDNGTGGTNPPDNNTESDNDTGSCPDVCLTQQDIDDLNTGWSLVGTGCDQYDMSIFVHVQTVWRWTGSTWEVYSPLANIQTLLNQYNISSFDSLHAKEGFWVKK